MAANLEETPRCSTWSSRMRRSSTAPAAQPVRGDLGVTGGKIAAVGGKLGAAKETVKADGLALAPGIIDGHTHYDAQITWDPFVDPSPALGVTTAVMGNCGFTIAPCKPADRDLTMRHLTHVEGMSLDALRAGIRWGFESFPQYLDMLAEAGRRPQRRLLRRPFGDPHLRDGRGRDRAHRDRRRRSRRWPTLVREADGGGRRRLRHLDAPRRTTARAARRCRRGWPTTASCARWSTRWARAARRLHADQGQQDLDPLSRGAGRRGQAAGGDRRPLPFQHQSRRRPSRRSTR